MVPSLRASISVLILSILLHLGLLWLLWGDESRKILAVRTQPIHLVVGHLPGGKMSKGVHDLIGAHYRPRLSQKNLRAKSSHALPSSHREKTYSATPVGPSPKREPRETSTSNPSETPQGGDQVPSRGTQNGSDGESHLKPAGQSEREGEGSPLYLGEGTSAGDLGAYEHILLAHIRQYEHYPKAARLRRIQGQVTLLIRIRATGTLEKVAIQHSSGSTLLDGAALEIMEAASPFPAPSAFGFGERSYLLPLVFSMHGGR